LDIIKDRVRIINLMMGYLSNEHRENISQQAFVDIANVFLDLIDGYIKQFNNYIESKENDSKVKWVCDAPPGHGKTTVLVCLLKWLVSEHREKARIPILLVIRENKMADEIFNELKEFNPKCIIRIDSSNKEEIEKYVQYYQIVIVTHSRLDNLALGYGNKKTYKIWDQYPMWDSVSIDDILTPENHICSRHRLLVIDEKPSFVNSSIFDIVKDNNALDWFEDLSEVLELNIYMAQSIKSQIIILVADQLSENLLDITTALIPEDERKNSRNRNLLKMIKTMKNTKANMAKIGSLKTLKHLEKLLVKDGIGRIDDYEIRGNTGRKIMVAERIEYGKLGLNLLVLDGTANVTQQEYVGFSFKSVANLNNYSRLFMCQDVINTSKYSRSKKGNTTQIAISERINELREKHDDLFVLPMKSDIQTYISLGAIEDDHREYFEQKAADNSKPINLLNTIGKNHFKDITSLYLTSLPRMNADYYKLIAISLYGNDVSLKVNDDDDSFKWFADDRLNLIYKSELYAEVIQIIHRTALRKITEDKPIHIYIAFDDAKDWLELVQPIFWEINNWYADEKIQYSYQYVSDEALWGRGDAIRIFAEEIHKWISNNVTFFNSLPKPISEIDKSSGGVGERFRNWLKKHWNAQQEMINKIFNEYGYMIYEQKDRYSGKTKYIRSITKKSKLKRKFSSHIAS
jgi:DNA polymerase III delta prime subunit